MSSMCSVKLCLHKCEVSAWDLAAHPVILFSYVCICTKELQADGFGVFKRVHLATLSFRASVVLCILELQGVLARGGPKFTSCTSNSFQSARAGVGNEVSGVRGRFQVAVGTWGSKSRFRMLFGVIGCPVRKFW